MNRLTGALLIAAALALAGCGGGGGEAGGGTGATDVVSLATKMIDEATSEECPTAEHCTAWPVRDATCIGSSSPGISLPSRKHRYGICSRPGPVTEAF